MFLLDDHSEDVKEFKWYLVALLRCYLIFSSLVIADRESYYCTVGEGLDEACYYLRYWLLLLATGPFSYGMVVSFWLKWNSCEMMRLCVGPVQSLHITVRDTKMLLDSQPSIHFDFDVSCHQKASVHAIHLEGRQARHHCTIHLLTWLCSYCSICRVVVLALNNHSYI